MSNTEIYRNIPEYSNKTHNPLWNNIYILTLIKLFILLYKYYIIITTTNKLILLLYILTKEIWGYIS